MMGHRSKRFKLFTETNLEALVPVDNFYRRLEGCLDLSFVRELVRDCYEEGGRPSIDPVVFFKLHLIAFFEGITSGRRLMEPAAMNLAHPWYLGYDLDELLPDHSSLSKIRSRYGVEAFQRFFERIVELCMEAGLDEREELYFDATRGEADASMDSLRPRLSLAATQEHVRMVFEACPAVVGSYLLVSRRTSRDIVGNNRDVQATWHYHEGTKHSFQSVHSSQHFLDFENQPLPFKIYSGLEPIPLPRDIEPCRVPALQALAASVVETEGQRLTDLKLLARLLHYSAGITKRIRYPHGERLFRAASCTGALYHVDLDLVCGDLPDLEAGVYHFGVHDSALRRLRCGDFRGELVGATAGEQAVASAPVVLICSSTFWRNSWKYQARTYRHCFWDSGTILANLLAMTAAHRVPARVVCGFVDDRVNRLLGLEPQREVALALVPLGRNSLVGHAPEVTPLALETTPLSRSEVDYPAIRAMHEASSLTEEAEVA